MINAAYLLLAFIGVVAVVAAGAFYHYLETRP
jgi:hypothetical protein